MPNITKVGRVMLPVSDQDEAIRFYMTALGFSLVADVPFGENDRWVEVAPPGGGTVPLLFFFRDNNKNQLMIVQAQ